MVSFENSGRPKRFDRTDARLDLPLPGGPETTTNANTFGSVTRTECLFGRGPASAPWGAEMFLEPPSRSAPLCGLQLDEIAVWIRDVGKDITWSALAAFDKPPTRRLDGLDRRIQL